MENCKSSHFSASCEGFLFLQSGIQWNIFDFTSILPLITGFSSNWIVNQVGISLYLTEGPTLRYSRKHHLDVVLVPQAFYFLFFVYVRQAI